jgi:hypothetical protein
MTVLGQSVTKEQASEIIVRTNRFLCVCNDREWNQQVNDVIGLDLPQQLLHCEERLGILRLDFLVNSQIMSSWVGGAHGWVDWNGNVRCNSFNIGKWPSVDEVFHEWSAIAETFPFLKLRCQLWSGEISEKEIQPLVEFQVEGGAVTISLPRERLLDPTEPPYSDFGGFWGSRNERGCDLATLTRAVLITERKIAAENMQKLVNELTEMASERNQAVMDAITTRAELDALRARLRDDLRDDSTRGE